MSFLKDFIDNSDDFSKFRKEEIYEGIDRFDEEISYETFALKHLIPNRPCLFGPWITKSSFFIQIYFSFCESFIFN